MGYQGITVNIGNKTGKRNPPGDLGTALANDPRVREALELSIDRNALNQVAWDGQYTPGCSPLSPVSPYFDSSTGCSKRDVAKAKQLLADAGYDTSATYELPTYYTGQLANDVVQAFQAYLGEIGVKVTPRFMEPAAWRAIVECWRAEASAPPVSPADPPGPRNHSPRAPRPYNWRPLGRALQ
jgi:peptide/nickel transport system substrate-binding protein